ncbi:hypothetical protein RHSIM_Rhsim09G0005300 [Rhododendron simsii]|uniref:Uncharacterized protein n=1 Tax=Rhododendron simsii TaxID=118357 RepID=A0A834GE28_RHOSS|nr:hypothetical protein RHSIM_Rhsim09G0005300 [Rhododendron simsii]
MLATPRPKTPQKPSTKSNSAQAHGANLNIVRTQTTSERHEPEILVNRLWQHPICHQILKKSELSADSNDLRKLFRVIESVGGYFGF